MIRVSQWSEIRYVVEVEHVPKRDVARRLSVTIKTVRRALSEKEPRFRRRSPPSVRPEPAECIGSSQPGYSDFREHDRHRE